MNPKTNQDFENDPPAKWQLPPPKQTQPPLTDDKRPAPKMIFIFLYLLVFSDDRI